MAGRTVLVVRSIQDSDNIEVFDSRQSAADEMSLLTPSQKDRWSKASLDYHLGKKELMATYKGYRIYERPLRMSDKKRVSRQNLSKRRKGKHIGE